MRTRSVNQVDENCKLQNQDELKDKKKIQEIEKKKKKATPHKSELISWKWDDRIQKELELPYEPTIPLLSIHQKQSKSESQITFIFMAALFTIAKIWKQPTSSLTDKWIQKMWYINTVKYCSALKKEGFVTTLAICDNMDESRGHYGDWNKPDAVVSMIPLIWVI